MGSGLICLIFILLNAPLKLYLKITKTIMDKQVNRTGEGDGREFVGISIHGRGKADDGERGRPDGGLRD
ncbi:hypothetical protein HYC85_026480 [Camellia sinensis]|uniref:Uncharacterized protein n=1 Tax=Camellia sinensis TaxID=4442 RepID=A0A7J7G5V8_CAMSI|nr:hypothetical protein HYC85_026480 [Camellia sinensis]